jgi:hypothetical protein
MWRLIPSANGFYRVDVACFSVMEECLAKAAAKKFWGSNTTNWRNFGKNSLESLHSWWFSVSFV